MTVCARNSTKREFAPGSGSGQTDPVTRPSSDRKFDGMEAFEHGDGWRFARTICQRARHFRTGAIAVDVHDARGRMRRLAADSHANHRRLRSNGAPKRTRSSMRAGASRATSAAICGSQRPAPAAIVSAACACHVSPGPTAAAMPPWARTLEPDAPGAASPSTRAGKGASFRAVNRPAMPGAEDQAPSASMTLSICRLMALTPPRGGASSYRRPACARQRRGRAPQ